MIRLIIKYTVDTDRSMINIYIHSHSCLSCKIDTFTDFFFPAVVCGRVEFFEKSDKLCQNISAGRLAATDIINTQHEHDTKHLNYTSSSLL